MYGFAGLYGQSYGITFQQRSLPMTAPQSQGVVKSNIMMQQQIGARPGYRVRETDADGCWTEYVRSADGSFKVTRGPRYVGMTIAQGSAAGLDWQRLDAKYRADDRTVPPGKWCDVYVNDRPPTDGGADQGEDKGDDDTSFPWSTVLGGLVVAGAIAGAVVLFRRKK